MKPASRHLLTRLRLLPLPLTLSLLLAACASVPPPKSAPTVTTPTISPVTLPSASTVAAPAEAITEVEPEAGDVWDRLRSSFAMPDCDADRDVLAWAHRYTRNPRQFEVEAKAALPKLVYVQKIAADHHVAGEFVFLPWVESGYRPVPGRRGRPGGMWQIMPVTASSMGLRVNQAYDGRLDVKSTADAVMALLSRYHDEFHDWRVVAYAYNTGEGNAQRLVQRHGLPPATPVIPRWPVRDVTRQHLTKLLAMACVVRDPARFHVSLPDLPASQHLVPVRLTRSMSLASVADRAGMPLGQLKELNAAFRNRDAKASANSWLMLPARHAQQFRDAPLDELADADTDANASDSLSGDPATSFGDMPAADPPDPPAAPARTAARHRVKPGETLWQLARRYHVSVRDLERWNHLSRAGIKPGQVLKVGTTH